MRLQSLIATRFLRSIITVPVSPRHSAWIRYVATKSKVKCVTIKVPQAHRTCISMFLIGGVIQEG